MPVDLYDVAPSVIVIVDKAAAPRDIVVVDSNAGIEREIAEGSVAVVVVKVAGIVRKVGLEDVEPTIAVVVGHADAHAGLLVPVIVVSASGHDRDIGEGTVVVVLKQHARL